MGKPPVSYGSFDAETILLKTIQSIGDAVVLVDRQSRKIILVNSAFEKMFGYTAGQAIGQPTSFLYPDNESFERGGKESLEAFRRENSYRGAFPMVKADGTIIETQHTLSPIYDENKNLIAAVSIVQDRTEWLEVESQLKDRDRLIGNIADNLPGAIYSRILRPGGNVEIPFFRGRLSQVLGLEDYGQGVAPDFLFNRIHPDDKFSFIASLHKSGGAMSELNIDLRILDKHDQFIWLRTVSRPHKLNDGSIQWDAIAYDVSAQYEAEEKLDRLSNFDHLTGLSNRNYFHNHLDQLIAEIQGESEDADSSSIAVVAINLNRFKFINSTYGLEVGDELLISFAERLRNIDSNWDCLARIAGDEFALLLSVDDVTHDLLPELTNISRCLAEPFTLSVGDVHVTASIGIALAQEDGSDTDTLIRNVESALHMCRQSTDDSWTFYSHDMSEKIAERLTLEQALREAIELEQLVAHYQPQVDPLTSAIIGLEALVRWEHPEQGTIYPDKFIGVAEDCGLIGDLGRCMIKSVCKQYREWEQKDIPLVPVSINISAKELNDSLYDFTQQVLADFEMDPANLLLEVTEGLLIEYPERAKALFERLNTLGVQMVLDDFGTGYSALSYLQRFNFEKLKIDRAFVQSISEDEDQAKLVKAIIAMAESFHMHTVAEGVETQEQLRVLIAMGCDCVQGWVYSKALSAEAIEPVLVEGKILPSS